MQISLLIRGEGCRRIFDKPVLGRHEQVHQGGQALVIRIGPKIPVIEHEQIKGMERVTNAFTVQDEVPRQLVNVLEHGFRQTDEQPLFVDTVDFSFLFTDQHTPAIELLLHNISRGSHQPQRLSFIDGIQELRQNASESFFGVWLMIGRAVFTLRIPLGLLFLYQLLEDPFRVIIIQRHVGLGAGVHGRSSPAISRRGRLAPLSNR
ncbi:MAG: hypothetical protein WCS42_04365 [Verrucomicrobiota bacterium]